MRNIRVGLFVTSLVLSDSAISQELPLIMSHYYQVIEERINAQYKADQEFCNLMSDSMRTICMVEAKGQLKVEKYRLEARRNNSEINRNDVMNGNSGVHQITSTCSMERTASDKETCLKEAKSLLSVKAKAETPSQLKNSNYNRHNPKIVE